MSSRPPTQDSPPRKSLQQYFLVENNVMFTIQLSSSGALRGINNTKDIQIGIDCKGTQTTDRVKTYRDRWLEEYYCADNLEYHMPSGIHMVDLPQIPEGAPSPTFFPGYLDSDDEYLEHEEVNG
ncbi:hypothetical protein BD769DRAFT_1386699 [Suillus cothurnatus]|nr:hypothetical protein BD769DRAFT_1386699 [Suillus cothurnatus]